MSLAEKKNNLAAGRTEENLPAIAVAMVTMNRSVPLLHLLDLVANLDYPQDKIDLYIADNASTDGTVRRVRSRFPKANVIENKDNAGISAGFNQAINAALEAERTYKYIWLLDDDAVLESRSLTPLVEAAEGDPGIAAVGSVVFDIDRKDHQVTAGLNIDWKTVTLNFHRPLIQNGGDIHDVDVVAACSMFTRASVYRKLGLWDESFWLYWGDTDWCTRVKANGYRVCCHTGSKVWHRNWARVLPDFHQPIMMYDHIRGGLLFNFRHSPGGSLNGVRRMMVRNYLKAAVECFTQRPHYPEACSSGIDDFSKGNYDTKAFFPRSPRHVANNLEGLYCRLRTRLTGKPRILLNQIGDLSFKQKIKQVLNPYFKDIHWEEIPARENVKKEHLAVHYHEYLVHYIPDFFSALIKGYQRYDLVVSPISNPELVNIILARFTLFVSPTNRACLVRNDIKKILAAALGFLYKGVKTACADLTSQINIKAVQRVHSAHEQKANER